MYIILFQKFQVLVYMVQHCLLLFELIDVSFEFFLLTI